MYTYFIYILCTYPLGVYTWVIVYIYIYIFFYRTVAGQAPIVTMNDWRVVHDSPYNLYHMISLRITRKCNFLKSCPIEANKVPTERSWSVKVKSRWTLRSWWRPLTPPLPPCRSIMYSMWASFSPTPTPLASNVLVVLTTSYVPSLSMLSASMKWRPPWSSDTIPLVCNTCWSGRATLFMMPLWSRFPTSRFDKRWPKPLKDVTHDFFNTRDQHLDMPNGESVLHLMNLPHNPLCSYPRWDLHFHT